MPGATSPAMYEARDAEDRRLLEAGEHKQLLATYLNGIGERCAARIRDRYAAEDVAQEIVLRLWRELEQGKHRGAIPFRVVVWQVTDWLIGGHFKARAGEALPLEDWDAPVAGRQAEWEERHDLALLAETLPGRQRELFELVYLHGLTSGEAADRLGIEANAAYQALHNAHRALAEVLVER